jgi:hypothetical protein
MSAADVVGHGGLMEQITDPTDRRVLEALEDDGFDFRTVQGLSESTGVPEDVVQAVLDRHGDRVRLSAVPGPNGEALYAPSSRPITAREHLALAQTVLEKTVS